MFLSVQKRRTSGVCGHLRNRKIFGISDIRNEPLWLLHRVTWLCLTAGCKIIELLRGPLAETLSANSLSGCVLNLWQGQRDAPFALFSWAAHPAGVKRGHASFSTIHLMRHRRRSGDCRRAASSFYKVANTLWPDSPHHEARVIVFISFYS